MWDERYSEPGYAYGTEPNGYLKEVADRLPVGRCLSLAEGEGRNAVFLAGRGHQVLAVDASGVGLAKARALAEQRGVHVETLQADLAHFRPEPDSFDCVVSIFCHVPRDVREELHAAAVAALRPGGMLVLEAYTPQQIGRGTGGPPVAELMMSAGELERELAGLEVLELRERERDVVEGRYHTGTAHVVQVLARKPAG